MRGLILVIVIGLIFFWFLGSKNNEKNDTSNEISSSGSLKVVKTESKTFDAIAKQDSDGDGLMDWEEILWKTDINNSDTDGDKTGDKEEVDQKRDPAKSGPDDQLAGLESESKTDITLNPKENLTQTETLAVDFFNNYLNTQGTNVDPSIQEYLNKQLINKVSNVSLDVLVKSDLKITNQNNTDALRNFGNQFGQIFINDYEFLAENPFVLSEEKLAGDKTAEAKLASLPSNYQSMIDKMLALSVPSELSELHLNFLNDLYKAKQLISQISQVDKDPILAMTAIGEYRLMSDFVPENMAKFNLFYISKGVFFEVTESGYLFQAI